MTKHVVLNNIEHKDLRIIEDYSEKYGDDVNSVLTFPTEFSDIQRNYPILFKKSADAGVYQPIALLGLEKNENLFLHEPDWRASYVPSVQSRGPFLIGFQEREADGEIRREPIIHVDIEDPRVNEKYGSSVFKEHGGNTAYLEKMVGTLQRIHQGLSANKVMSAEFERLELFEPVSLEIEVHKEHVYKISNFYTINTDKLAALRGETLERLHQSGFLQCATFAVASLANINSLIELKRSRLLEQ
ncbi:SapC family protein [Gilvimarinus agarilyticus]|uniref:SapC family protein n=1 Tax=Gilvimarinus agarilyticus TaxID=679259 RepID=UPI0005A094B4|nr:SapC family protein [Gilvimarinus agarilyticus]